MLTAKQAVKKAQKIINNLVEERRTLYTRLSEQATHLANLRTDLDDKQTLINLINSEFSSCKKLSDFKQLQEILASSMKSV